ncbi:MAG: NADH dehydrogenase FAD-containing subunit, partial [Arenicella sp.]
MHQNLVHSGVCIRTQTRVICRDGESLIAENGSRICADLVVLNTGLEAPPLVGMTGLAKEGLRVNASLHAIADPRVFAGGDCAAMEGHDLPKLDGKALTHYMPQKRYLAILNLGGGCG